MKHRGIGQYMAILFALLLTGCSTMQDILDKQHQELGGLVRLNAQALETWTIITGDMSLDVSLVKTFATKKYRLSSIKFKHPIDLRLDTIDKSERFVLDGQTVLVFHGRYGAEQVPVCEVVSFGKKIVQTLVPAGIGLAFQPSADGKNLLGAPVTPNQSDSFFVATTNKHLYPLKFTNLDPADGNLYWAHIAPQITPTPGVNGKVSNSTSTAKSPTVKLVPTVKQSASVPSAPKIPILAPTPAINLPTQTTVAEYSDDEEKPVVRLD